MDCAAKAPNLAIAVASEGALTAVECGHPDPEGFVLGAIDWDLPVVVAIDAPLGWPSAMRHVLPAHRAGMPIPGERREFFTRQTDRLVHDRVGQAALWVGADRIACTAHRALALIDGVRAKLDATLPLLWREPDEPRQGIIEVYPAATLRACCLPSRGYKGSETHHRTARQEIVTFVAEQLDIIPYTDELLDNDDKLDAVVCTVAATDFLDGRAIHPSPLTDEIRREGWIWVRDPQYRESG